MSSAVSLHTARSQKERAILIYSTAPALMAEIFIVNFQFRFKFVFHHQCYFPPPNSLTPSVISPVILCTEWCEEYAMEEAPSFHLSRPILIGTTRMKENNSNLQLDVYLLSQTETENIFPFVRPFKDSRRTYKPRPKHFKLVNSDKTQTYQETRNRQQARNG